MALNAVARIWSPYKELQYTVESAIQKKQSESVQDLEAALRKHKADFISLLQNPAKNAAHREVIRNAYKEGLPVQGQQGTRLLSQQFIQEALTLSDLFDLNEYAAVELLMAGESQQPFFPGFKRGLVAVLLYYDGRSSLVSTLRTLIQARKGRTWSLGLPDDILSVIMNFTVQLMNEGLAAKILYLLQTFDVTKELDRLQSPQFRALGCPRHRRQVTDKIKEIKLTLGDCLFCWCCQSPLSKTDTQALMNYLRSADDDNADGTLSDVTLKLLMAFLYNIDPRVPECEQGPGLPKLPIFMDPSYVPGLTDDILSDKKWANQGLHAVVQFGWAITLHTLSQYQDLEVVTEYFEKDEMLIDMAVEHDVFLFLRNSVLANPGFHSEEYYVRQMHNLVTDFIVQMPLKMKEMRNRGDETSRIILANQQNGLEPPAGLRRDFEHFLFLIGDLYMKDSPDRELALEFWYLPESVVASTTPVHNTPYTYRPPQRQISLYKFVRLAGDLLSPPLFIPYLYMLRGLANGHQCAHHCFNLLLNNGIGGGSQVNNVSWDHFFMSMHQYYTNLRQEMPMTSDLAHVYRHHPHAISSQEVEGLIAVVQLLRQIAFWDDHARIALCENPHWHLLVVLLGLVSCDVPARLKAELLRALAAFCKTPDIAATLWQSLEASQIIPTISFGTLQKRGGLHVELEEIEAREEEFPITRGFLELMNAITDNSIPAGLGSGYRVPGFAPYLEFLRDNILLKFNTRAYRNPDEKWEVGKMVLEVLYKILADYEVTPADFFEQSSEVQNEASFISSKRPGFILMEHMLNDSNMLKMILYIIDEATKMLDKYIPFPGKEHLEQAALWCLKMIETACIKQEEFLDVLRESNSDIIVSQMDKLLMSINRRSGKADHLVNLAKYVTYNSWLIEHALAAVHILSLVSSSPIVHPHLVGLFTADQEISQNILHGFVECLENPEEPEDIESDSLTSEDSSAGQIKNATRQEIIRLILRTLNQPAPNLAHFLLGFEIRKPVAKTDLQDPGVLGCPRTCLHALLSLLNHGLDSQKGPLCVWQTPRLAELGYHLVYTLCADSDTSGVMMRYLRTHNFLYQHLQHLPFRLDGYDGQTSATESHLLAQEAWLLRTTAIELRLTSASRQRSHTQRLLNLLMDDTPLLQQKALQPDTIYVDEPYSQYDLEYSMFTSTQIEYHQAVTGGQSLRKILSILETIDFAQEMPPVLQLEVFNPALIEQVVTSCEKKNYLGLMFTDIQLLHRILMSELHASQSSATGKRPHMIQEIQEICTNVVARNNYRELLYNKKQAFDAWRQVVEIILTACPEDLLQGEPRQSVIFELLQDLLAKVSKEDAIPELTAPVAGVILTLMANLRMCFLKDSEPGDSGNNITQYVTMLDGAHASVSGHANMFSGQSSGARTLFASSLQVVLKRLLEHMMRSGSGGPRVRAYLYGALLHYLQIAQKPRVIQIELGTKSGSIMMKMTSKENEYERLTRENMETLSSCGDNLMEVVCRDACDGHDIGRTLALATLDLILCVDKAGSWLSHLSSKGYLQHIIDSLLQDNDRLRDMLQQQPQSLKVLYIFESKIGLLTRIAATAVGAQTLLQCGLTTKLAECSIFDFRPERERATDSYVPSVMSRYRQQILFPVLKLCLAILTSMGIENRLASQQVIKFILAHERVFSVILCDNCELLHLEALQELALTTSVIGRTALDESLDEAVLGESTLVEYRGTLSRIQRQMLALLTPYSHIERLQKQLSAADSSVTMMVKKLPDQREEAELAIGEIASNVIAFARAMLSKSGPRSQFFGILFQPSLAEAMGKDAHTLEGLHTSMLSSSRSQNLGVVVHLLQQCTQQLLAALDSHKHHARKYTNIANLTAEEVREFCTPGEQDKMSSHQRQHIARQRLQQIMSHKAKQIQLFSYIIENCLYIVWHHLEYYFLHCMPSDSVTSLVKIHAQRLGIQDSPGYKHPANAKLDSSIKRDDLNQLKQDAVLCINETLFKRLMEIEQCYTRGRTHYGFIEALIRRLKRLLQLHSATS